MKGGTYRHKNNPRQWTGEEIRVAAELWKRHVTDIYGEDELPKGRIFQVENLIAEKLDRSRESVQGRRVNYGPAFNGLRVHGVSATAQFSRVPAHILAERERRNEALDARDLTGVFCGDPPKGWSALDRASR